MANENNAQFCNCAVWHSNRNTFIQSPLTVGFEPASSRHARALPFELSEYLRGRVCLLIYFGTHTHTPNFLFFILFFFFHFSLHFTINSDVCGTVCFVFVWRIPTHTFFFNFYFFFKFLNYILNKKIKTKTN